MNHDDRSIPLDPPEPIDAGLLQYWWAGIRRALADRNRREEPILRRRDKETAK